VEEEIVIGGVVVSAAFNYHQEFLWVRGTFLIIGAAGVPERRTAGRARAGPSRGG